MAYQCITNDKNQTITKSVSNKDTKQDKAEQKPYTILNKDTSLMYAYTRQTISTKSLSTQKVKNWYKIDIRLLVN